MSKNLRILGSIVGVLFLIQVILVVSCSKKSNSSEIDPKKACITSYYTAVLACDSEYILSHSPQSFQDFILELYGLTEAELKAGVDAALQTKKAYWEEDCGSHCSIEDTYFAEAKEYDCSEINSELGMETLTEAGLDLSFEEGYEYFVELTIAGDEETYVYSYENVHAVRIGDTWYSVEALFLLFTAAEEMKES